ncbi:MAG: hypothetical protein LBN33_04230 [Desulfovibrio sp.]|nr:hypothetical protein [Desulfovibrio sp.]
MRPVRPCLPLACLAALLFLLPSPAAPAGEDGARPQRIAANATFPAAGPLFAALEPGLEISQIAPAPGNDPTGILFTILRIDPEKHEFTLGMASEEGRAYSLLDWSLHLDLRAGINASMYLPDGVTSTGYMRKGQSVNNEKIGGRLGAFFVANPTLPGLPKARILERGASGMPFLPDDYSIVVQNFRFMDSAGNVLWREGGPVHSIAAVAEDAVGRILFILCREPLPSEVFAARLKDFALSLRTVMYVEGGAQAGLFLRLDDSPLSGKNAGADRSGAAATPPAPPHSGTSVTPLYGAAYFPVPGGGVHIWKGLQSILNTRGNPQAALPNIIGIKRRSR